MDSLMNDWTDWNPFGIIIAVFAVLTVIMIAFTALEENEMKSKYKYKVYSADGYFFGYTNETEPKKGSRCIKATGGKACGTYFLRKVK